MPTSLTRKDLLPFDFCEPDHAPLAEHCSASDADHLRRNESPTLRVESVAESVTVGAGVLEPGVGVEVVVVVGVDAVPDEVDEPEEPVDGVVTATVTFGTYVPVATWPTDRWYAMTAA